MDYVGLKLDNPHLGDNGIKTLRQLQVDDDDDERFQEDLKQAVRQSLGKSLHYIYTIQLVLQIFVIKRTHSGLLMLMGWL